MSGVSITDTVYRLSKPSERAKFDRKVEDWGAKCYQVTVELVDLPCVLTPAPYRLPQGCLHALRALCCDWSYPRYEAPQASGTTGDLQSPILWSVLQAPAIRLIPASSAAAAKSNNPNDRPPVMGISILPFFSIILGCYAMRTVVGLRERPL
jgi:hypothetical protein